MQLSCTSVHLTLVVDWISSHSIKVLAREGGVHSQPDFGSREPGKSTFFIVLNKDADGTSRIINKKEAEDKTFNNWSQWRPGWPAAESTKDFSALGNGVG